MARDKRASPLAALPPSQTGKPGSWSGGDPASSQVDAGAVPRWQADSNAKGNTTMRAWMCTDHFQVQRMDVAETAVPPG